MVVNEVHAVHAYEVEKEGVEVHIHLRGAGKEAVVEAGRIKRQLAARGQLGYPRYLLRAQGGAQSAESRLYGAADVECDGRPWYNCKIIIINIRSMIRMRWDV